MSTRDTMPAPGVPDWAKDPAELYRFFRWMQETEELDVGIVLAVLDKPQNWQAEYDAFVAHEERRLYPGLTRAEPENDGGDLEALLQASVAIARGGRR